MPDVLLPDSESAPETTDTSAAEASPAAESTEDAAYDSSYAEAFGDGASGQAETPEPPASDEQTQKPATQTADTEQAEPEQPEPEQETPATDEPTVTASERQALEAAGLTPELYGNWSREQTEAYVSKIREQQAETERVKTELEQLKPKEDEPKKAEPHPDVAKAINEAMEKLTESYDDEIKPLGDALNTIGSMYSSLAEQHEQAQQQLQVVNPMMELLSDLVLHNAMKGLEDDYPSISAPESREAVSKRFWTEWNTGAYSDPEKSIIDQIHEAASNAAKVTFLNTNEQTAAASLASKNQKRVKSQPKVGPTQERQKPKTEDDIYDEAFQEILAKQ